MIACGKDRRQAKPPLWLQHLASSGGAPLLKQLGRIRQEQGWALDRGHELYRRHSPGGVTEEKACSGHIPPGLGLSR